MKRTRSTHRREKPLVVVLNNDILPYRIPLFRALATSPDLRFHFLFCSKRAWDRAWKVDRDTLRFHYTILHGFILRLRKPNYGEWRTIYINPGLLLHLLRLRPEVVVGYEYSVPALTALFYARLRRAAYVVWTDCTRHVERELTRGQRWTRRLVIPRARAYLGSSLAACENLIYQGAPAEAVFESPMSHDVARFEAEAERSRKDRRTEALRRVLYVGHLNERKGVSGLVRAFAIVARQCPEARLVLIGEGRLQKELVSLARLLQIEDRIEFGGFVQPRELPAVFASADVFVLPSLEDTFGVVVVEALASSVPVVCSRFAGVSSHLVDGTNAFLVDPNDVDQLAHRIHLLLSDEGLRQRMVLEGLRVARTFEASAVARPFVAAALAALGRLPK
jgi:glycosyltransferase involved in cell wall biosynthesis